MMRGAKSGLGYKVPSVTYKVFIYLLFFVFLFFVFCSVFIFLFFVFCLLLIDMILAMYAMVKCSVKRTCLMPCLVGCSTIIDNLCIIIYLFIYFLFVFVLFYTAF